jgi:pyrimidine-nucleoside phosphorylase
MNQPLGHAVGNALEVREAIAALAGAGPPDLTEHCLQVAGHMLRLAGRCSSDDLSDARPLLEGALADGSALATLRKLVLLQGGDASQIDRPETLPSAPFIESVDSPRGGYLAGVDALGVAHACLELGAGRKTKNEPIDPAVGVVLSHQVGAHVEQGEPLFTVHAAQSEDVPPARDEVLAAFRWSDEPTHPPRPEVVLG